MLTYIKQLETDGRWVELLCLSTSLTPGDPLARVFVALSKLQEDAAAGGADYHRALYYAKQAAVAGVPGGLMWTWAQGRSAALAADLGIDQTAEQAARVFLDHLPTNPGAAVLAPWVWAALARVRARQGRNTEAVALWHQVLSAADGELAERAQLHLVWTLAEAGQVQAAVAALPTEVRFVSAGLLAAAQAAVAAASHDWPEASAHARTALRRQAAGEWAIYDTVQTAELLLILQKAAQATGDLQQASIWFAKTAAVLSRWNAGIMIRLVPTLRAGGGEYVAATDSRGSAGSHRWSLTGTVG